MSSRRMERHRNYGEIMARHERELRLKRVSRIFTYFLVVVFLLIIFFIVIRWEQRESEQRPTTNGVSHGSHHSGFILSSMRAGWCAAKDLPD